MSFIIIPKADHLGMGDGTQTDEFSEKFQTAIAPPPTMGEQWLLKQFCLNHPVEHIQKPKLPKLYVRVETSTSYFIIHNQFVK